MPPGRYISRPIANPQTLAAGIVLALGLGLTGCASVSNETTGSVERAGRGTPTAAGNKSLSQMNERELAGAVRRYGEAYDRAPGDKGIGLSYASALQMAGRNDQSLAVMQQVAIEHSEDREVLAAYGKALAAAGQFEKALGTIRRAQTPDYPDARLYSAEGAILDQLGRPTEARTRYRKSLEIRPNDPATLSNLGMSYLLTDDLAAAERTLRRAIDQPNAESRVRQNLALVVGLQGRFDEAERIASATLSPETARENVAYLRSMLAREGRDTWAELADDDRENSG